MWSQEFILFEDTKEIIGLSFDVAIVYNGHCRHMKTSSFPSWLGREALGELLNLGSNVVCLVPGRSRLLFSSSPSLGDPSDGLEEAYLQSPLPLWRCGRKVWLQGCNDPVPIKLPKTQLQMQHRRSATRNLGIL